MPTFDVLMREVRGAVTEIDAQALASELAGPNAPAVLDVREPDEYAQGALAGATHLPRGYLELRIEQAAPNRAAPIVLYCAAGTRSVLAARSLTELGYTSVRSLAGGFNGWKREGLPWAQPAVLRADQEARYSRHMLIPEIGAAGQHKLLAAKILCIGAGGLGSPVAMYLAAAGVGTLGIVDDDQVDASNLQRQILHATDRIGMHKVDSAAETIRRMNPDVVVEPHRVRLTHANAVAILGRYDVIVDGTDNFPTRYLVNDAAQKLGKPVVHASVFRFDGQLTVFAATGAPCYRCLYPEPPAAEDAPSCAEAGVLGVLPGTMGLLQATEALKLVLGIGTSLVGRLLIYDALDLRFRELKLKRDPKCPTCGDGIDRASLVLVEDARGLCAAPASAQRA